MMISSVNSVGYAPAQRNLAGQPNFRGAKANTNVDENNQQSTKMNPKLKKGIIIGASVLGAALVAKFVLIPLLFMGGSAAITKKAVNIAKDLSKGINV